MQCLRAGDLKTDYKHCVNPHGIVDILEVVAAWCAKNGYSLRDEQRDCATKFLTQYLVEGNLTQCVPSKPGSGKTHAMLAVREILLDCFTGKKIVCYVDKLKTDPRKSTVSTTYMHVMPTDLEDLKELRGELIKVMKKDSGKTLMLGISPAIFQSQAYIDCFLFLLECALSQHHTPRPQEQAEREEGCEVCLFLDDIWVNSLTPSKVAATTQTESILKWLRILPRCGLVVVGANIVRLRDGFDAMEYLKGIMRLPDTEQDSKKICELTVLCSVPIKSTEQPDPGLFRQRRGTVWLPEWTQKGTPHSPTGDATLEWLALLAVAAAMESNLGQKIFVMGLIDTLKEKDSISAHFDALKVPIANICGDPQRGGGDAIYRQRIANEPGHLLATMQSGGVGLNPRKVRMVFTQTLQQNVDSLGQAVGRAARQSVPEPENCVGVFSGKSRRDQIVGTHNTRLTTSNIHKEFQEFLLGYNPDLSDLIPAESAPPGLETCMRRIIEAYAGITGPPDGGTFPGTVTPREPLYPMAWDVGAIHTEACRLFHEYQATLKTAAETGACAMEIDRSVDSGTAPIPAVSSGSIEGVGQAISADTPEQRQVVPEVPRRQSKRGKIAQSGSQS
jgi:hypothetical protein